MYFQKNVFTIEIMEYILFTELNLILLYRNDPQIRPEKKGEQWLFHSILQLKVSVCTFRFNK